MGTNSITVTAGSTAVSGNISVTATNACGSSTASVLPVSVGTFAYASAGPDQTICAGTPNITLAGQIGGVISGQNQWDWSSSVPGGSFSNGGNNLTGTYTIPASVSNGGTVTITISTIDPSGTCAAVTDDMIITILPAPTASISVTGANPVCSGNSSTVTFTGTPNTTVTYTVSGVPGSSTINIGAGGTATLNTPVLTANTTYTLTNIAYVNPPVCTRTITGSATVTVSQLAVANAGPDQTSCASATGVTLAGSVSPPATSGTWSGGTGTFTPNNTTLNAVYTPSAAEVAAGTVTLTLTTDDPPGPCGAATDQITITISPAATVNANADQVVCASSPNVTLAGSVGGSATTGTWSGGAGSFSPNNTTLNAIYIRRQPLKYQQAL